MPAVKFVEPAKTACFDTEEQWQSWLDAARLSPPGASGPCQDCNFRFQTDMINAGRCDHPRTKFRLDFEGGVQGVRAGTRGRPKGA
jgi:hypothetical protein